MGAATGKLHVMLVALFSCKYFEFTSSRILVDLEEFDHHLHCSLYLWMWCKVTTMQFSFINSLNKLQPNTPWRVETSDGASLVDYTCALLQVRYRDC